MFCGISAFRSAAEKIGGFEFVGYCECDPTAIAAYRTLYDTRGEYFCNDARAMFFIVANGNVLTAGLMSPKVESECSLRDILIPDQYKDAEGKTQFSEICHPVTADLRHQLTQSVMTAYDQALQQAQQQGVKETQDNAPKIKPEM